MLQLNFPMRRRIPFTRLDLLLLILAVVLATGVYGWLASSPSMPRGWHHVPPRVPVSLAALAGELPPTAGALSLNHFEGYHVNSVAVSELPLELTFRARLPTDGLVQLALRGGAPWSPSTGLGVRLEARLEPGSPLLRLDGPHERPLSGCTPEKVALPVEQAWHVYRMRWAEDGVSLERDGQLLQRCETETFSINHLALQSGLRRVLLDDVKLSSEARALIFSSFDHPAERPWVWPALLLGAALALFGLRGAEVRLLRWAGLLERNAPTPAALTLSWLPLVGLLWLDAPLQGVLEALRLVILRGETLVAGLSVGSSLLLRLAWYLRTYVMASKGENPSSWKRFLLPLLQGVLLGLLERWPLAAFLGGVAAGAGWLFLGISGSGEAEGTLTRRGVSWRLDKALTLLTGLLLLGQLGFRATVPRTGPGGILLLAPGGAGLLGLSLLLVSRLYLVNVARALGRPNLASLLLVVGLLGCLEGATRQSWLDRAMADDDSLGVLADFDYLRRVRQPTAEAARFYPVAWQPRGATVNLRIACLGGSSTAGAYQMRDLNQFYPRLLQNRLDLNPRLGRVEVLNQGVGGWTTLHMRRHLELSLDRLQADILTFYVGHNDLLTLSSVPYSTLWERLESRGGLGKSLAPLLNTSRLYVMARQLVVGLRYGAGTAAVPVGDARANLDAILTLASARGITVVLMSEGLNPDPMPLADYARMLEGLARQRGALYLDTATLLHHAPPMETFLDDCHLTRQGHELIADALAKAILENPALLPKTLQEAAVPSQPTPLP